MKAMKLLMLGLFVGANNAKYGSIWIDDNEDVCLMTSAPAADDILLLAEQVKQVVPQKPQNLVEQKYGDVTVHISKKKEEDPDMVPDRYSKDSDDHLMNMLIAKGYAFSKEPGANVNVIVDCGCNCNCCFGQKKLDLWEISKDCGCNCGCCNYNKLKVKTTPQFWINKAGAEKAGFSIVAKNKGLSGPALEEYMNMNFGALWDEYDVLKKDMVEVE